MNLFGRIKNGQTVLRRQDRGPTNSVVFPGPEGWELWEGAAAQAVCLGPMERPGQLRPGMGCVMSLPSRSFFSLPLWVPVIEDSPAREQTQIKLEMKGMLGANPDAAVWGFEAILRETIPPKGEEESSARQLEATAVLALPFHEEWLVEEAVRHEPAGRMLPPPVAGSGGVLRRELGHWVADFYQGNKWLHTQPLLSPRLDASAAVELRTTLAQLEGEGILSSPESWLVREEGAQFTSDFPGAVGAPVRMENRSAPRSPAEPWNLCPPVLQQRREQKIRTARQKHWIRMAVQIYLLVGFVLLAFLAWPLFRLKVTRAELGKISAQAASIRSTALLWREAGGWLNPRLNALEVLWQVSQPLIEEPAKIEGVNLTSFSLNGRRLLLEGEGEDLVVVEKYRDWLKNKATGLEGFTWRNPPPKLLPNNKAQFTAEGFLPGVAPEAEKEESE